MVFVLTTALFDVPSGSRLFDDLVVGFHDLFVEDSDEDSDDDDEGGGGGEPEWLRSSKADCLLVHRMVSAAVDETGCDAYPGEVAAHRPPPGSLHACYAWLNVNRSADSNFMHTHQVDLWSAVFYVSEGEPNAPRSAQCPDSNLPRCCAAMPAREWLALLCSLKSHSMLRHFCMKREFCCQPVQKVVGTKAKVGKQAKTKRTVTKKAVEAESSEQSRWVGGGGGGYAVKLQTM